jgi:signal recognition particle receptor subunit beta
MGAELILFEEEYQRIHDAITRLEARRERPLRLHDRKERPADRGRRSGRRDRRHRPRLAHRGKRRGDGRPGAADREKEFSSLFHEGEKQNIHITLVAGRVILLVVFDETSSLGLVRLRVRKATGELAEIMEMVKSKAAAGVVMGGTTRPSPRSRTKTSTTCLPTDPDHDIHQLRRARNQLQARLLRSRSVREDDEHPVHLRATNPVAKGKLISLATETDRTLFFDFMPLDLGTIQGFKTRFHLYTVPGQVFYDASRRLILKGVDGVIFVADSQESRFEANVEAIQNLKDNMKTYGYDLMTVPYVLQLNKRDLPTPSPPTKLVDALRVKNEPVFEAVATTGAGVFETLKAMARMVLLNLRQRSSGVKTGATQ